MSNEYGYRVVLVVLVYVVTNEQDDLGIQLRGVSILLAVTKCNGDGTDRFGVIQLYRVLDAFCLTSSMLVCQLWSATLGAMLVICSVKDVKH